MANNQHGHCFYGVDYAVPPYQLPTGALADAQNILPTDEGLPTGRSGSAKQHSNNLGSRITSFHEFRSGSITKSLCSYSTKIASYNEGTGEYEDKITGLTEDRMVQWVNFAGKAICVNEGSDAPQYYESEEVNGDLPGNPPNGLAIAEWSNRLWFMDGATLVGSALNAPTDYTGGGEADDSVSQIVGDSGDNGTGLFGFFDMLLVGKNNNIYKVTGAPATNATTLRIEPLYSKSTDNAGFTSPWAITQVGNDVIFLDGYEIKRLSGIEQYGDVEYVSISSHFRDFLKATVDKDYLKYTHFFHYKKRQQIWITIPTGASTHYVFVLDYKFKELFGRYAFYPMSGLNAVCFSGVQNGEVSDIYYGSEDGFVYQLDVGNNDSGSAIDRYFVSMVSGNDPANKVGNMHEYRKQFDNSETFILPTESTLTMTPSHAIDIMNGDQIRTSGNYTALNTEVVSGWSGIGVKQKRIKFLGLSGRTLALKWAHNKVAENFVFYPGEINYTLKSKNSIT